MKFAYSWSMDFCGLVMRTCLTDERVAFLLILKGLKRIKEDTGKGITEYQPKSKIRRERNFLLLKTYTFLKKDFAVSIYFP